MTGDLQIGMCAFFEACSARERGCHGHIKRCSEQPRLGQDHQDASCDPEYNISPALQAFTNIYYSHGLSNKSYIQDKSPAHTYRGQVGKQHSKHTGSCTGIFPGFAS